jgi:hypothetical protein
MEISTFELLVKRIAPPPAPQDVARRVLEPLGVKVGKYIVDLNPFDKFIKLLINRLLERYTVQFLAQLRQRQSQIGIDLESLNISNNEPRFTCKVSTEISDNA